MRRLLLAWLCLAPAAAWGAVDVSGYVKNLYTATRSPLTRSPYYGDLTRARLTLDVKAPLVEPAEEWLPVRHAFRVHVDYDHELRLGTFLKSRDFALAGLGEPPSHFALGQTINSGTDGHYRHLLYRGWAELRSGRWHVRFGRQRIAWGTGKIWNPTDFLNPYLPTLLERDERRGIDAVYLRRGVGTLGQGEIVYSLARRWSESDLVARMKGHVGQADVSVSGGKVAASSSSWTFGADLAATLFGGTFHGEFGFTDLVGVEREPFVKGMVGYEYSFPAEPAWTWFKDVWVSAEYFHNGHGASDPKRYNRAALLTGREVSVGRDYLGWGLRKELHPLLEMEFYQIFNILDRSHFFGPSITWNVVENFYLEAGWQRFGGAPASEYGGTPNGLYFQAQYFF